MSLVCDNRVCFRHNSVGLASGLLTICPHSPLIISSWPHAEGIKRKRDSGLSGSSGEDTLDDAILDIIDSMFVEGSLFDVLSEEISAFRVVICRYDHL